VRVATVITRLKGGPLGRLAAHHSGVSRIVKSHYGFPFTNSGRLPRRRAYAAIECRPGRLTDATLCVRCCLPSTCSPCPAAMKNGPQR
jgi:hypothetical protein